MEQRFIGGQGPLHQAALAGEPSLPLDKQSHGDEKAQGGPGLAAVQHRERSRLDEGVTNPVDPDLIWSQVFNPGAQI